MLTSLSRSLAPAKRLTKPRLRTNAVLLVTVLVMIVSLSLVATAQNVQHSKNSEDLGLRHNFAVDPVSLSLNFQVTLGGYSGRGGSTLTVTMRYSSKVWRLDYFDFKPSCQPFPICDDITYTMLNAVYGDPAYDRMQPGWSSSLELPYVISEPEWFIATGEPCDYERCGPTSTDRNYIKRLRLRMPDGSTHEMRVDDNIYFYTHQPTYPMTYVAVDGSRIRYVATGDVNAQAIIYLPDGSRYLTENNGWGDGQFIDRNGNTLTYESSNNTWTDSLGRSVNLTTLPGYNSGALNFSYSYRQLKVNGHPELSALTDFNQALSYRGPGGWWGAAETYPALFQSFSGSDRIGSGELFNPSVLYEIQAPGGRKYTFTYNTYGEIDKIIYPTGGYERFEYATIPGVTALNAPYQATNRGVVRRWVSSDGTPLSEQEWQYNAEEISPSVLRTTVVAPDGTVTERYVHRSRLPANKPFGFDDAKSGMVFEQCVYAPGASHGQKGVMLRRSLTEWGMSQYVKQGGGIPGGFVVSRDPRVSKQVEILLDTGGDALTSMTTYTYDSDLNVILTNQYDYAAFPSAAAQTGSIGVMPQGSLLRATEATFLVNDPAINSTTRDAYRARNLIALPTSSRIKDAGVNIVAQSETKYDEPAFPFLTYGAVSGWTDPGSVRGMPTTNKTWLNTNGSWLQAHAQYDQFGGPRNNWSANDTSISNPTQIEYSSIYNYAYPTRVISPDPDASGPATSLITTTAYDLTSGFVTATTDPNNQTTTYEYAATDVLGAVNPLQRLTRVVRPDGGWTAYGYNDTVGSLSVVTRTALDASRYTESAQHFDGLGRAWRSVQSEGATSIYADVQYDSMGRPWKTSSPYRSGEPAWTISAFDALSRVISVTTPDGAQVTTAYAANTSGALGTTVTVTDQAGIIRRSLTNALGQLIRVDEPDTSGSLGSSTNPNQATSYTYDALSNLTQVAQGTQTPRTFVYNSLSRLTSATNPESGTISFTYDNNGNLITKTDARGIVSTFAYDALNRNTAASYTNDPANTPPVTRSYDGATKGKGRLHSTVTEGSSGSRTTIDAYDNMGRPLTQRQQFYSSGWSPSYTVQRSYNLAGQALNLVYPSEHSVNYNYDAAGRLGDKDTANLAFSGNLGGGTQRTYARGTLYAAFGGMKKEQFGTDTAIYNKLFYNSREQLSEIRLSTSYASETDTNRNRGSIINNYSVQCSPGSGATCNGTDNNGNITSQEVFIPHNDAVSASTSWYQKFDYDELNRLKRAKEYNSANTLLWQQEYQYDRWGNRRVNQTNTWGPSSGPLIPKPTFEVQTATNRLYGPGDLALNESQRSLQYDASGNLKRDTYSGAGDRSYDAENKMTKAWANGQWQYYTYNGDGQRVRRKVDGVETWQVYGMEGELLAEYGMNASASSAQKEYGYRNGQLLITAEASFVINVASAANGGTATASSEVMNFWNGFPATATTNGDRRGANIMNQGVWADTNTSFPDWLQIDFNGSKTISEIDVFTEQDNLMNPAEPTETMTFSQYGLTGYDVQYWNGSSWVTVTGGSVTGNNKIWRKFTFTPITTSKIRVLTNASGDGYSRLTEVEAWGYAAGSANINWLVTDHLGTPRMILDKTGSLANVKRHDYLPFGEELVATQGSRTTGLGYTADTTRQKFTEKERDIETGLDYFGARYYGSTQGRFTSVDPVVVRSSRFNDPQRWNLYGHARENPLKFLDPDGRDLVPTNDQSATQLKADLDKVMRKAEAANIKVVAGKNVGIIDPGAIDVNTASRAYRGLLEVIKPGITRNYSTATADQDVVVAGGSTQNVGSGATFFYSDDPTRIDIYVPSTDAPQVWGQDGTPIDEPRYMVTAHEVFGESTCGGGQCAVRIENEIRDDLNLPRRSGSDHQPLANEIHPQLTIPPTSVTITESSPIPVPNYTLPTNIKPTMRPKLPLPRSPDQ